MVIFGPCAGGLLTLSLSLAMLCEQGFLTAWVPRGVHLPKRCFYYSKAWQTAREALPGLPDRLLVQWWDDHDVDDAGHEIAEHDDALVNPVLDPSRRGHLDGFVETFVRGKPRNQLIRKVGFGMDPPFRRMRDPFRAVVEMRTQATRTFGYYVCRGVYVAYRLDLADRTHSNRQLYEYYGKAVSDLLGKMLPSDKDEISDVEDLIGE
jgi:hypothetical protein